jgi:hypothetical protein
MTLQKTINQSIDLIGAGFSEEGKKQLRETYEAVARQAMEEERMTILEGLPGKREVPHERPRRWDEHTERDWENGLRNDGFNDCLSHVKSLIQKDN